MWSYKELPYVESRDSDQEEYCIPSDGVDLEDEVVLAYVVADNMARMGFTEYKRLDLSRRRLWGRVSKCFGDSKSIKEDVIQKVVNPSFRDLFSLYNQVLESQNAIVPVKLYISKIPQNLEELQITKAITDAVNDPAAVLEYVNRPPNDGKGFGYALVWVPEVAGLALAEKGFISVGNSELKVQVAEKQGVFRGVQCVHAQTPTLTHSTVTITSHGTTVAKELKGALGLRFLRDRGYKIADKCMNCVKLVIPKGGPKPATSLEEIMAMSPTKVELWAARLLSHYGWDAVVTLDSKDMGVDVVGFKENRRRTLQVKRRKDSESAGELFKTLGGSWMWGATEILFVCTGGLIEKATGYANAAPVPLYRVESEKDIQLRDSWI